MTEVSNTGPKQKFPGGPFVKGDPRINRKGRPKTADQAKKLILSILAEQAQDEKEQPLVIDGHIATKGEVLFRAMMNTSNPSLVIHLLEMAFGKVVNQIDVTSRGQPLKGFIGVNPDDWDNNPDQS